MTIKSKAWKPLATCSVVGDICTLTPLGGRSFTFLAYDHFKAGVMSGWLLGYWREVLMPGGRFLKEPICPLPFRRFEVVEQAEGRLVLRVLG